MSVKKGDVRSKIHTLLVKRISEQLELLQMSELTALAYITANSDLQKVLKLGEFILNRAEMLTESDLTVCLDAFDKSGDDEKLRAFEQIAQSNLPQMSLESASAILYTYAKERRGSQRFISELAKKVESHAMDASELEAGLVAQIVVSLNLIGRTESAEFGLFGRRAREVESELS
jgi:hypothetical protein